MRTNEPMNNEPMSQMPDGRWAHAKPLPFYEDGRPWCVRAWHSFRVLLGADEDKLMKRWWVPVTMLALLIAASPASADKPQPIKVIAFDCFGTVYDLSGTPKDEIRDYIRQVRRPEWAPLDLPASWMDLKAFPDSAEGISRLRKDYIVVTCANAPLGMLATMAKRNGIEFDAIIPLEMVPAYKPDPRTYQRIADVFGVDPSEVLMVTGNEGSPDLTVPKQLGMQTQRIRGDATTPQTITELADQLRR